MFIKTQSVPTQKVGIGCWYKLETQVEYCDAINQKI